MTAAEQKDSGLRAADDLRHRPVAGERTRDSLFWQLTMPEHQLGVQVYLYLTGSGKAGYNVCVWGPGAEPLAMHLHNGRVPDHTDLDDFSFDGLTLSQPEPLKSCLMTYDRDDVRIQFAFTGIHDAFSYRSNPDGLPSWFAQNRIEQTGQVRGGIDIERAQVLLVQRSLDCDRTQRRLAERPQCAGVRRLGRGNRQCPRKLAEIERVLDDVVLEPVPRQCAGGELGVEGERVYRLTQRCGALPGFFGKADHPCCIPPRIDRTTG